MTDPRGFSLMTDYQEWKKHPPEHLPAVGSLVEVENWAAKCLVVERKPLRYSAGKPKRWKVIVQNPGTGETGWLRFPHDPALLDGWWKPGKLVIHPADGDAYDASVLRVGVEVPTGLASFQEREKKTFGSVKPKELGRLYKCLVRAGYSVRQGRKKMKVYDPDGNWIVSGSITASRDGAPHEFRRDCVRRGIPEEVFLEA